MHIPFMTLSQQAVRPLKSVTNVRRQTYGYLPSRRASLPIDWYHIMLLGDRALGCEQLAQSR